MGRYQDVKPLETKYKGYRFRSRLEARWAVFFDELEIKFHYEFQDVIADGKRVLPDFYFPHFSIFGNEFSGGAYGEVKPYFTPEDVKRCKDIERVSDMPVLLLDAVPDFKETRCIHKFFDEQWESRGLFMSGDYTGSCALRGHNASDEGDYFTEYDMPRIDPDFIMAVHASRAARF